MVTVRVPLASHEIQAWASSGGFDCQTLLLWDVMSMPGEQPVHPCDAPVLVSLPRCFVCALEEACCP